MNTDFESQPEGLQHSAGKNTKSSSPNGMGSYQWGQEAEEIAVDYLTAQGYPITERNYRVGNHIEIDIISRQDDEMVFIEVKARNGKWGNIDEAIDSKKKRKLIQGANAYLRNNPFPFYVRFDVIFIEGTKDDYELTYIKNAFYPI